MYLQSILHVFIYSLKNIYSARIQDTIYKTLQTGAGHIAGRMPYSAEKPATEYFKQKNSKLH